MKRLGRAITPLAMLVWLAGCAGLTQTIQAINGYAITQGTLDATRNSYDGTALAALKSYAGLPLCAPGKSFAVAAPCHDKALLKRMRKADAAVDIAFDAVQDQVTSGNNAGAVAAYKTLSTAIDAVKKIIADNGLPGL